MKKRMVLTEGSMVQIVAQDKSFGDHINFALSRSDDQTKDLIGAHGNMYTPEKVGEHMPTPSLEIGSKKVFTIISKKDQHYVGDIRLTQSENNEYEIGIVIIESERNKGYGSDAIMSLAEYSFSKLKASKLWLRVYKNNPRAYNLYIRLGFIYERTVDDGYVIDNVNYLEDWLALNTNSAVD